MGTVREGTWLMGATLPVPGAGIVRGSGLGLQFHEFLVVGRGLPSEKVPEPKIYRMRLFAPNALVARSKFWYFMKRLSNIKKMTGEILATTEVRCWSNAAARARTRR